MITYGLLLALALFMRFGPDIPFRRMLNRHLVERLRRGAGLALVCVGTVRPRVAAQLWIRSVAR